MGAGGLEILHRMLPPGTAASATEITCIGQADENGVQVFTGRVSGTVLEAPRGEGGFGFDPVFAPDGDTRSLAEIDDAEKDQKSPRGIAPAMLAEYLSRRP